MRVPNLALKIPKLHDCFAVQLFKAEILKVLLDFKRTAAAWTETSIDEKTPKAYVTTTISWSSGTTTQNLNCSVSLLGDTNNVNFVVITVQARLVAKLQEITSL